jgi:pimeloyl-ACP methyl ester carboxylesterase
MTVDIPAEPLSRHFHSQGLKLHYLDWGNADAPTLVLVHGGHDHGRSWDRVAMALRKDWHVVVPDLRGHGDSEWSPDGAYATPFFLADFAQLVCDLGEGPVAIVAHSLGAAITLRYASAFPERVSRIAAIEGVGLSSLEDMSPMPERLRSYVEGRLANEHFVPRTYPTMEDAVVRMRAVNPHLEEGWARHLTEHGVRRNPDGSYGWNFDPRLRPTFPFDIGGAQLRQIWRAIACPVWLVHGADSWAKHPEDDGRAAEFADARVTSFADAGHWVQHDRFDAFVGELAAFLRAD